MRKLLSPTVAGFARFAVSDAIGNHDEVLAGIEEAPGFEKHAGKVIVEELFG
jgi:hypothetical protein